MLLYFDKYEEVICTQRIILVLCLCGVHFAVLAHHWHILYVNHGRPQNSHNDADHDNLNCMEYHSFISCSCRGFEIFKLVSYLNPAEQFFLEN